MPYELIGSYEDGEPIYEVVNAQDRKAVEVFAASRGILVGEINKLDPPEAKFVEPYPVPRFDVGIGAAAKVTFVIAISIVSATLLGLFLFRERGIILIVPAIAGFTLFLTIAAIFYTGAHIVAAILWRDEQR